MVINQDKLKALVKGLRDGYKEGEKITDLNSRIIALEDGEEKKFLRDNALMDIEFFKAELNKEYVKLIGDSTRNTADLAKMEAYMFFIKHYVARNNNAQVKIQIPGLNRNRIDLYGDRGVAAAPGSDEDVLKEIWHDMYPNQNQLTAPVTNFIQPQQQQQQPQQQQQQQQPQQQQQGGAGAQPAVVVQGNAAQPIQAQQPGQGGQNNAVAPSIYARFRADGATEDQKKRAIRDAFLLLFGDGGSQYDNLSAKAQAVLDNKINRLYGSLQLCQDPKEFQKTILDEANKVGLQAALCENTVFGRQMRMDGLSAQEARKYKDEYGRSYTGYGQKQLGDALEMEDMSFMRKAGRVLTYPVWSGLSALKRGGKNVIDNLANDLKVQGAVVIATMVMLSIFAPFALPLFACCALSFGFTNMIRKTFSEWIPQFLSTTIGKVVCAPFTMALDCLRGVIRCLAILVGTPIGLMQGKSFMESVSAANHAVSDGLIGEGAFAASKALKQYEYKPKTKEWKDGRPNTNPIVYAQADLPPAQQQQQQQPQQ